MKTACRTDSVMSIDAWRASKDAGRLASLKEIVENLIRSELTKEERAVHEVKYTHLVKKLGLAITADEKRALSAKNQHTAKAEGKRQTVVYPPATDVKPTATEKVTVDLGITSRELERSHQKVNELARSVARDKNLMEPVKVTAKTAATPEAEHTLRLAELGAQTKTTRRTAIPPHNKRFSPRHRVRSPDQRRQRVPTGSSNVA